jgi:hypothetical protein
VRRDAPEHAGTRRRATIVVAVFATLDRRGSRAGSAVLLAAAVMALPNDHASEPGRLVDVTTSVALPVSAAVAVRVNSSMVM